MLETWYKMASLIQSGLDLSPIIIHYYKVDDFPKGFDAMRSGACGKVILDWEKLKFDSEALRLGRFLFVLRYLRETEHIK